MEVYTVENTECHDGYGFYDIVCANSEEGAKNISIMYHGHGEYSVDEFDLEVNKLEHVYCNSNNSGVISSKYLDQELKVWLYGII